MVIKEGRVAQNRVQKYMDTIQPLYDRSLKMTQTKSQKNLREIHKWLK